MYKVIIKTSYGEINFNQEVTSIAKAKKVVSRFKNLWNKFVNPYDRVSWTWKSDTIQVADFGQFSSYGNGSKIVATIHIEKA
jgi:hypothetical protein